MDPFKIQYPRYPSVRRLDDTDRNILADLMNEPYDDDPSPYLGNYSEE